MAPADEPTCRPLLAVDRDAFARFDLHLELRRLLWCGVAVLAVVLLAVQAG
jgi:hypothetical protein